MNTETTLNKEEAIAFMSKKIVAWLYSIQNDVKTHDFDSKLFEITDEMLFESYITKEQVDLLKNITFKLLWLGSFFTNFPNETDCFLEHLSNNK